MFPSHSIPAHCDRANWTKWEKCSLNRILLCVIVDASHIDPGGFFSVKILHKDNFFSPAHDGNRLLSLEIFCLLLLMSHCLLHQHQFYGHLWQENKCFSQSVVFDCRTSIAYFLALCRRAPCTADSLGRPMPNTPLQEAYKVKLGV